MTSLTFKCEVITPMFLGGANPAKTELRAASIKGALRFWWRAMNGDLPLEELKRRESLIFGGVTGDNALKSGILIRVNGDFEPTKQEFSPNPYLWRRIMKTHPTRSYVDAKLLLLEYLAFGPVTLVNKEKIYREYIQPETTFTIEIILRKASISVAEITKALTLMSVFGGLGARSRNGFGRFDFQYPANLPKQVFSEILTELKGKPIAPFTSVSSQLSLWQLKQNAGDPNDWNNVLFDLGSAWLGSRVNYDDSTKLTTKGIEDEHHFKKRVYLGSPLIGNGKQQDLDYKGSRPLKLDRHAKSHFFGLHKNGNALEGYMLHLPYLLLEKSNIDELKSDKLNISDTDISDLQTEYEKVYKAFNGKLTLHSLTPVTL